jgi:hypothetical protein
MNYPVILARSASDNRDIYLPVLQDFANRIGRPLIITADHTDDSMTPTKHVAYAETLLRQMPTSDMNDILTGVTLPFYLHFFSAPLLRTRTSNDEAMSLWRDTRGHQAVLDWHWPADSVGDYAERVDEFNAAITRAVINNYGASTAREYMLMGSLVDIIYDRYITDAGFEFVDGREGMTGLPGAIVCENGAFIPRDVLHSSNAAPLLIKLLDHIDPNINIDPAEKERRRAEAEAARIAREQAAIDNSVDDLKDWINNLSVTAVRTVERNIEEYLSTIRRYQAEIVQNTAQLTREMATMDALKRTGRKANPNEIENLRKMMKKGIIKSLTTRVSGGNPTIEFTTRPLLAMDDRSGAYHLIGRLNVKVNMGTGAVTVMNLDRQVNAFSGQMHAPHVWNNGDPCLGNFSDTVAGFLASGDWYAAIELTIAFLESANTDDPAGSRVHLWPFVEDPTEYGYPEYEEGVPDPFEYEQHYDDPDPDDEER